MRSSPSRQHGRMADDEEVWLPTPRPGVRFWIDERNYEDLPNVGGKKRGITLGLLVEQIGGYEGTIEHPFSGEQIAASLEPWRGRDTDSTWFHVAFEDRCSKR